MIIKIKTAVEANYLVVYNKFDRDLFLALAPKFGGFEVVQFDGSQKGARVHIRMKYPVPFDWISEITEDYTDAKKAYFIDEGLKVPFGIRFWKHQHIVHSDGADACIIEDYIEYKSRFKLWDFILYPVLFMMFFQRKPIYKSYFNNKK